MSKAEMNLQEAFDTLAKRIDETQALALSMIGLHKMTLGALVDLDLIKKDDLADALQKLAAAQPDNKPAQAFLNGIAAEYRADSSDAETGQGHLKLVDRD